MRIEFDVESTIEAKGWSNAWYEVEEIAGVVAHNLQRSLWRAYSELGNQIAQPLVEVDGVLVIVETAHDEIEQVVREAFDAELLNALAREYEAGFFDDEAVSLTNDILFDENGEVDAWIGDMYDRLLELGVEWSGLPVDAEYVTDSAFSQWVDFVRTELEDALTDLRIERENPLLGVLDLAGEGYYLDLAESVRVQGFECDGKDAVRVLDLIDDLEENPQIEWTAESVHEAVRQSDEAHLVLVARRLKEAGVYDVAGVVQECVTEYAELFRPDLSVEWPEVGKATLEAVEELLQDIDDGDRVLSYLYQEAQKACIYYADVTKIIEVIGLDENDELVDEPGIAFERVPGEEMSRSTIFTRLAVATLKQLTVTYAVKALGVLAGELRK